MYESALSGIPYITCCNGHHWIICHHLGTTIYVRSPLNPRELDRGYTGWEGDGDWTWVGCKIGKKIQLAVTSLPAIGREQAGKRVQPMGS